MRQEHPSRPCAPGAAGASSGTDRRAAPVRLDRMLAHAGCGSRREVRQWIKQGRVTVNGKVERDPGRPVRPGVDAVAVDGQPLDPGPAAPVTLMLHKPRGVITATRDATARTVNDLLPPDLARRVVPAGRLDKDTEGLLILTEDGALCHRLISPRHGVEKEYWVQVHGPLDPALAERFAAGIRLDDGYVTRPARLRVIKEAAPAEALVVLTEGRYHQVKRMFAAVGRRVLALRRVRVGGLRLDPALAPGAFRPLTPAEVQLLLVNPPPEAEAAPAAQGA
ncbi:MAG TPA: pseudouridine synthase [Limnochordales bacterium]|nr:pseudouridine synthase [Limnochordales bacterium]